ncbi:MAG: L,D-transpeptidase [Thiotrichales bacterium]|nr:L,D-transpeptidase [Thiotrichales bacterium]
MCVQVMIYLSSQTLEVWQDAVCKKRFFISSAKAGSGNQKNSGQTPLGRHYIRAKIGAGVPVNGVFVGRRFTGEIYSEALAKQFPQRDWILTRILWLCGCELGHNRMGQVDTMQRYIYLHGTPDSEPMGVPLSHGCIRLRNQDLLMLFDWVRWGTAVEICP